MLYKTSSESKGFKTKHHICAVQRILQAQQQYVRTAANCEQLHHSLEVAQLCMHYTASPPLSADRRIDRSITVLHRIVTEDPIIEYCTLYWHNHSGNRTSRLGLGQQTKAD